MNVIPQPRFKEDARVLLENLGPLPQSRETPFFIALSGLPGSGKTTIAKEISRKLPVVILESDALRKVLFSHPTYSWQESNRLFRACYYLIDKLLKKGFPVLLDATNLTQRDHDALNSISSKRGLKIIFVKIMAPQKTIKKRLEERMQHPAGYSDANWEVYQLMKTRVEKIRYRHLVVNTAQNIQPQIEKIIHEALKVKEL